MSHHLQNLLGEPSRDGTLATVAQLVAAADAAALHVGNREAERVRRGGLPMNNAYHLRVEGGSAVDEDWCVPPTDGLVLKGPEPALVARGWRFVAVPKHLRRKPGGDDALRSPIDWVGRSWLVVPPEGSELAARTFAKKGPALAWAQEQVREALS